MTKRKENSVIKIAGQEFVVTQEANSILKQHLAKISRKYRLNRKVYKELTTALRDILLSMPEKRHRNISKQTATEAVQMVGDSYDNESKLSPLQNGLTTTGRKLGGVAKRYILTETFRKRIYLSLAAIMLIPIALSVSSLSFFNQNNDSISSEQNTFETTMGQVRLGDYASEKNAESPQPYTSDAPLYSLFIAFFLAALFFYFVAQHSTHAKLTFALALIAIVASINISDAQERTTWANINNWQNFVSTPSTRTVNDFDKLLACGTEINLVFGSSNDGMFYELRDNGYKLATELETKSFYEQPSRDQICTTYDKLRQTLPDSCIVLQSYVKDEDNTVRAIDYREQANRSSDEKKVLKERYGFFTK